jgi:hypothetical protein
MHTYKLTDPAFGTMMETFFANIISAASFTANGGKELTGFRFVFVRGFRLTKA